MGGAATSTTTSAIALTDTRAVMETGAIVADELRRPQEHTEPRSVGGLAEQQRRGLDQQLPPGRIGVAPLDLVVGGGDAVAAERLGQLAGPRLRPVLLADAHVDEI